MTPTPIGQMFEQAIVRAIIVCGPLLANTGTMPPVDELGAPMSVPMTADYQRGSLTAPLCHVSVEEGATDLAMAEGLLGYDPTTGTNVHLMTSYGSKLVFTFYTATDPQRRYLADYLRWNLVTAYTIASTGERIDGYPIEQLKAHGIYPANQRRFEPTQYPPEDTSAARPFGQPWRSVVKLNCEIATLWQTPTISPISDVIVVTGQDGASPYFPPESSPLDASV